MKPRRVQVVAPRESRCWAEATPSALDSEWGRGVLDAEKMGDRADRSGQHGEHQISAAGDRSGARDREDPGRRNVPDYAPVDGVQPVARATPMMALVVQPDVSPNGPDIHLTWSDHGGLPVYCKLARRDSQVGGQLAVVAVD